MVAPLTPTLNATVLPLAMTCDDGCWTIVGAETPAAELSESLAGLLEIEPKELAMVTV